MNSRRGLTWPLLFVVIALALNTQTRAAAAISGISSEDAKNIMPVSQIKRGMRGYGLTVFQGTKVEKFDVVILGVLKQMNAGRDLILIRAGGGPITGRGTGILSGMSGSPCYINGKLIGAVAMGLLFSKEPIGMVTPIADMLEAWDDNLPKTASGYSSPQPLSTPMTVDGKKVTRIGIKDTIDGGPGFENGTLYMQPLATPLMVSGMSPRGIGKLAEILRPYNMIPMAGPGSPGNVKASPALAPGAALGMSLARGDIDITAVGTLTYRRGNRILAFGHPLLSIGAIDAPMTTAYVADVVSGYLSSTKLASPLTTVGRMFQDRPWSVAGMIGKLPATIPATIQIDDQATKRKRTFHVNVINHPLLASALLTMVIGEAVDEVHPTPGDATAEVSYEVVADQVGKISRRNVFFDPSEISSTAVADVGMLLMTLGNNRFYPLDIKSVKVNVSIVGKRETAQVDRIFVKKSEYEPGETVEVGVVLRPYKKDRITKTFDVKIPATAADGKVVLQVRGGASPTSAIAIDEDSSGTSPVLSAGGSDLANADNVQQLVSKYLERERNNEIVVRLVMRSTTLNVTGQKLTGLPSAIADVMKSSRNSGLKLEADEVKRVFDAGTIVYGSSKLVINVKRKDLKESKPGDKPPSISTDEDDSTSDTSAFSTSSDLMDVAAQASLRPFDELRMQAGSLDSPEVAEDKESPTEEDSEVTVELGEPDATAKDERPETAAKADKGEKQPGPEGSEKKTDVKTVVRQVKTWTQRTQADFAKGTFSGVAASTRNMIELSPTVRKIAETPEQFVWCVAPAKDGVYAGTGNSGKIYHITDAGDVKLLYETGELEVHSLVVDPAGDIYAGTSPHGKVFRITPDGKGKLLFKADERYVVALALDKDNNLYAGVGDAGKVYRITPDGTGSVFAEINEQQVLSLHWDDHGSLLAGTGINGVVYRVNSYGVAEPIFDAPEDSITSITSDGEGNVYAGTSPKGAVYKIALDGRSKKVLPKATRVLSMVCDRGGNVYVVSDGTLVKILPDETVTQLDSSQDKVQYLTLAYNSQTETLYAGTGNIGSVYASKCCDVSGTYESPVHDTGMISKWCRIKWTANTPEGTSAEVRTRTGNVATPDSTWTGWSAPYAKNTGEQIVGKDARYVQYQVTLKTGKPDASPSVTGVCLSYLTPNQPPAVKLSAPLGGEAWAGKQTIRWVGSDPDKDSLSYDIYYSSDGGKEWTAIIGGASGGSSLAVKSVSEAEVRNKIKSELEKSPDVPEDMKKEMLKPPAKSTPGPRARPASEAGNSSTKTSHEWDTTMVPDGNYTIKVVASDKPGNAAGALTDEVVSEPLIVCNKAPKLTVHEKGVEMKAAGPATVKGAASSELLEIAGVQYRVDGGDWASAQADDGVFDSPYEAFTVTTPSLKTGSHKVEIQAIDAAKNATSKTIEAKVAEAK